MLFDDFNFLPETRFGVEVGGSYHNPLMTGFESASPLQDSFFEMLRDTRPHPTGSSSVTTTATASASADNSIYVVGYKITSDDPAAGDPDGNYQDNFSGIPADGGGGGGGYPDPKPTPCVETTLFFHAKC